MSPADKLPLGFPDTLCLNSNKKIRIFHDTVFGKTKLKSNSSRAVGMSMCNLRTGHDNATDEQTGLVIASGFDR